MFHRVIQKIILSQFFETRCIFSVNTITHEPLPRARWSFAWTCCMYLDKR